MECINKNYRCNLNQSGHYTLFTVFSLPNRTKELMKLSYLFTTFIYIFMQTVCAIVAAVLHYFYTAVFVWMLVEGLLLYSKVVQVFGTEKSRVTYYCIFGWGEFPL